jgi:malate dehydrogenase (oxaloacetate-decarboxylating)(NADP+)
MHCEGLGLGSILAKASSVTDSMVEASSLGLANSLTEEEHAMGLLYPRIERSMYDSLSGFVY